MISFKAFLKESTELLVVTPVPLSNASKKYLQEFQRFLSYINFSNLQYDETVELLSNIKRFKRYPFAKPIIKKIESHIKEVDSSRRKTKSIDDSLFNKVRADFFNAKMDLNAARKLKRIAIEILESDEIQKTMFMGLRNLKKSGMEIAFSGGQSFGLYDVFDDETIQTIQNKDISKFKYTYIPFGLSKIHVPPRSNEFEVVAYIIDSLLATPKPKRLNAEEYMKFQLLTNKKYTKLKELVDEYIFNNDKSKIAEIKSLIDPFIQKAISKVLKGQTKVYRGIGGSELLSEDDIKSIDKSQRYVSTSPIKSVAERFARGNTHLDQRDRNRHGYLITYNISNRKSILFDTSIFGTAFREADILIDNKYAKITSIDKIK